MNSYGLIAQYPYDNIECALTNNGTIVESAIVSKFQAIENFVPTIAQLLSNHHLTLSDISYIGTNVGPGPFNTLRAMLATINGIHFANKVPLVTLNALELLLEEHQEHNTVAMLHAFGKDVYLGHKVHDDQRYIYTSITHAVEIIQDFYQDQPVQFIGNGALKYQELLSSYPSSSFLTVNFNSLQTLATHTYIHYQNNQITNHAKPLYLASPVIKN